MKINGITVWQKSDINGFFGLFTNNITNILVLTGLLLYAARLPEDLVFGRILPAVGLAIFISSSFYFYQGYILTKKEQRDNVTALPSGISVPHMFLIIFMIIVPVHLKTGNPIIAWQAGMAWCFLEGIIECLGAFVGKFIRSVVPRAALLGSLAGVSITYILGNGAIQSFEVAYISFASFAVILLGFIARKKMPFAVPAGLVAIVLGTILGWLSGYMQIEGLQASVSNLGFYMPILAFSDLVEGMSVASSYLIAAIPMGIYNFLESIDNLESAEVAGDKYPTATLLFADGATSMISAAFGNVVPTAIYIGHPGWKSIGARLGYTAMTGICVLLISIFGIGSILISIIPIVALLPILIYIGMLIGSQAFMHVPHKHFPAVILGITPWLADWGKTLIGNAVSAAGGNLAYISQDVFVQNGIYYKGFEIMGNGAIVIGVIWASLLVYMLENKTKQVIVLCFIAAILTFFGIIHSASVGIFMEPGIAIGYIFIAIIAIVLSNQESEPDLE